MILCSSKLVIRWLRDCGRSNGPLPRDDRRGQLRLAPVLYFQPQDRRLHAPCCETQSRGLPRTSIHNPGDRALCCPADKRCLDWPPLGSLGNTWSSATLQACWILSWTRRFPRENCLWYGSQACKEEEVKAVQEGASAKRLVCVEVVAQECSASGCFGKRVA